MCDAKDTAAAQRTLGGMEVALVLDNTGSMARGTRMADLKSAAKDSREVLIATDPDREGEAIAWHVAEQIRPKRGAAVIPIRRVLFHEITKDAVQAAVARAGEIDTRKVEAQQARRILDRNPEIQDRPGARPLFDGFWSRHLGDEYIVLAFRFAREADPDAFVQSLDHRLDNPVGIGQPCQAVIEAAGRDQLVRVRREERIRLEGPGPFQPLRGRIRRDIEEQRRDTRVGEMRGMEHTSRSATNSLGRDDTTWR